MKRTKSIAINWLMLCDVQGKLFELAWRKGFDMSALVPAFMKSRTAALIDSTFNHLQWAGEAYILEEFVAETGLRHGRARKSLPPEHLFWAGYLYRYWHCLTGETSKAIYAIADYRTMAGVYAGYHTLSNELAIENLTEDAKAA